LRLSERNEAYECFSAALPKFNHVNILYLAHRIPYPPNKGEKIRAFHQIKELAKTHAVHVCAFIDDPADFPHIPQLRQHCVSVEVVMRKGGLALLGAAVGFLSRRPLTVSLFYRRAFALKVQKILAVERFDCILCSSSSMAQYASLAGDIPKVIDFIDVDSQKWRQYAQRHAFPMSWIYRLEGERLGRYEAAIAEEFDQSILSSREERRLFEKRLSHCKIAVISNGVDLDYFQPSEAGCSQSFPPSIVFTGVMDYFPNIDAVEYFCREIYPRVLETIPEARFLIVGRNPVRGVKQLEQQSNVVVTGTVSDVRPYLGRAWVTVAPFHIARGIQNKVLESLAMGVPVVGTIEAFKGLGATERDGIRIGHDPVSFAREVTNCLRFDVVTRRQIAEQARAFVERHHRWQEQGAQLEQLIEDVVRQHAEQKSPKVHSAENSIHHRDTEFTAELGFGYSTTRGTKGTKY
jgi:sugar transferase (PEP-CTERM/EpsH1 system associated)